MNKGFTLVEVIIAVFVTIVGVVGVYSLVPHIIKTTQYNFDKFTAVQLARDGIEIIRNFRDSNWLEQLTDPLNPWNEDLDTCSLGCRVDYTMLGVEDLVLPAYNENYLKVDAGGFFNYAFGNDTKFKRKITITPDGGNTNITIKAEVFWEDGDEGRTLVIEEKLYDWRPIPIAE